jgi:hypothetical protein
MSAEYKIIYQTLEPVVFKDVRALETYLVQEIDQWRDFLEAVSNNNLFNNIQIGYSGFISGAELSGVLDSLIKLTGDVDEFNRRSGWDYNSCPPPPSTALDGRLILGLFKEGQGHDAFAAYLRFVLAEKSVRNFSSDQIAETYKVGMMLWRAALVSSVLPFQSTTSAMIKKTNAAQEKILAEIKSEAEIVGRSHLEITQAQKEREKRFVQRFARLGLNVVSRERKRNASFTQWIKSKEALVEGRFKDADKRLRLLDRNVANQLAERQQQHDELIEKLFNKLKFEAPVKLWKERADYHEGNAEQAQKYFYAFCAVAISFGIFVPIIFGEKIAASFQDQRCLPQIPTACITVFSAKGPLTIGGILLATSILLWLVRLQHKVYLSERHLCLDAKEKSAFAETYLAMRQDSKLDASNEGIVLQSLFRPTQDGIVRDDDNALDISAAALIAKQLSRP